MAFNLESPNVKYDEYESEEEKLTLQCSCTLAVYQSNSQSQRSPKSIPKEREEGERLHANPEGRK